MHTKLWHLTNVQERDKNIEEAAALIRAGAVVAFPTETVYGLGANGLDGVAVRKIFAAKGRPADNPLILHIASPEAIVPLTSALSANARRLMEAFWPGPMTLVVPKAPCIPVEVTAGLDTVAVRCPKHALAQELIRRSACPIAAPSANKSGRPSPTNAQAVLEDMQGLIAGVLDGGECAIGVESTVVDTTVPVATILRPGGITKEMLEDVLGAVELDPGLTEAGVTPKAPGMKYRHYAPQAQMHLVEGTDVSEAIEHLALQAVANGYKVGVLVDSAVAASIIPRQQMLIQPWGCSVEELAQSLYDSLRYFDNEKVGIIFAQGVSEDNIGLAVMNRMRKAAGNNILLVEDGKLTVKCGSAPRFMVQ